MEYKRISRRAIPADHASFSPISSSHLSHRHDDDVSNQRYRSLKGVYALSLKYSFSTGTHIERL
jgi:hypothetical protein